MPPNLKEQSEQPVQTPTPTDDILLRLQTAEYQALMTRGNSFMAFYVGMTSVVLAVSVFTLQQWLMTGRVAIIWLGAAAAQVMLHIWGTYVEEHYLLIAYIENNLRAAVLRNVPELRSDSFWQYEPFLASRRMHENWWGEWLLPGAATIALGIGVAWRHIALRQDLPWLVTNAALLLALLVRTFLRVRLRRSFTRR